MKSEAEAPSAPSERRRLRYAVFDLDGTVLGPSQRFLPGVAEGLHRLRAQGLRLLLVTGRSVRSFRSLDASAPELRAFDDPLLLSNGNVLWDRGAGSVTVSRALPAELAARLASADVADTVTETASGLIAGSRRAALAYARAYGVRREDIMTGALAADHRAEDAVAVTVFGAEADLTEQLTGLSHDLDRISAFGALVVRPEHTCKAAAVHEHVRRRYGESHGLSSTVAFGDARNDACLLGSAALGVAVQGADQAAVRHSDEWLSGPLGEYLARFVADRAVAAAGIDRDGRVLRCPHR